VEENGCPDLRSSLGICVEGIRDRIAVCRPGFDPGSPYYEGEVLSIRFWNCEECPVVR
jgi:hypothetical protein